MSTPLRVLIVEDAEDDTLLVLRELRRGGYEPTFERVDTPEAINAALEQQTWDIVLSDYAMPRFSMPAALAMVKEKGLDLPFIIVSGAIGEEAAVAAMRAGAHDYVMKSNLARLAPAVERELREAEVRRERKRAEEALRESEEHYSALVGNLTDAVFTFKGGVITWCNDRVEEIYSYPKEELLGKNASFFYPSDISPSEFTRAIATAIKKHGLFRGASKFQRRDGSFVDIEYSLSQIPGKDALEIIAVARDVTERRRMEEALRESEAHYRLLADNATDVIWTVDLNMRLTYISPSVTYLLGCSVEEAMSKNMQAVFTPASVELAMKVLAEELAVENMKQKDLARSRTLEIELNRKDGSTVPVEVNCTFLRESDGRPVEILVIARDITERKRAEEAVRRSEEYLRVLLENALDVIVVLNSDTTIRFKTPSFERMFGEARHGKNPFGAVHPDDIPKAADAFQQLMQNPGATVHMEIRGQHRDGSWRTFEVLGRNLLDNPAVAGIVANFRDITDRKRMEQQLQLAGRLAAVGELAAGIAHELNNPLTAVQAFAQFLTDRDNLDETVKSDVETIYREAQRATRITASLLRFARRHKPDKRLISINEAIEKALELHAYRLKLSNIEVLVELAPDLPMTMADSDQMHQAFVNIISNAEQAMTEAHSKGKLSVKTQRVGEMVQAAFTDDGPGIPEDDLKSIFDPFFTTKGVGKGTGLGLSICYGIVEEHGGHMYARSKPGKGATFVVEIPIVSEGQPIAEHADSTEVQKA